MRVVALFLFCIFSGQAVAQVSECQSVPKASDRLACYDRAAPPTAAGKPTASPRSPKSTAPIGPPDQGGVVDMLAVENSKLDAKIKTICRGC
jgi:hypothetical protein